MGDARREYLDRLATVGYVPQFTADGAPCAVTDQGNAPEPVFLLSIPKAGTYLAAEVMEALGVRSSKLHVDDGWASDFREFRKGTKMWHYQFEMPVVDALALVLPGQFAVGHLPCSDQIRRRLDRFSRVFIFRELRHAFVSWARFVINQDMDGGAADAARCMPDGPERVHWVMQLKSSEWLLPACRDMVAWRRVPGVLSIRFEDLAAERGPEAQGRVIDDLARHLEVPLNDAARRAARACVGSGTLTWSGGMSALASHWDARLEAWFRSVGGPELNRTLGYPEGDN
ncbi:hypothetical protein BH11PSE14_BH11PSE14_09860 [soil metagenome]